MATATSFPADVNRRGELWGAVAVLGGTAILLVLYGSVPYWQSLYQSWDLQHYLRMAQAAPGLAQDVDRPYGYRLLAPYLLGLLPLEAATAFRLFSIPACLLLGGLLYRVLLGQGLKPEFAALATIFFAANKYCFGFAAWNYFHLNDVLSLLFILGLYVTLKRRSWLAFAAFFLLGALARETVLLMLPTAAVYLWERRDPGQTKWLAAAVVPGLIALVAIRSLVPVVKGVGLIDAFVVWAPQKLASAESMLRLGVNAFAPFSLVPLVFSRGTLAFFRRNIHLLLLLVLTFVSSLFGLNDERLMAPAFLAFYLLTARLLQDHVAERRSLALLLVAAVAASFHHLFARWPLRDREMTAGVTGAALVLVTLVAVWNRWARRAPAETAPPGG